MSALPKAVQQQLDEAERMMQQGVAPAPTADPQPDPVEPPQDPQPPATPQEPQPAPQPAEPPQDAAYWRARFETMQGKYNAELPRMNQALQETQQQLMQLRAQVEVAQRQPAPAATPPAPLVTEKDDEKFGSDLIDMVRRVAREERRAVEEHLGRIDQLIRQVAPQLQRVQEVEKKVEKSREELFYDALAREVPDWETVNKDPRWLAWLTEYDPIAGKTRQDSLNEAHGALDVRRVGGLFKLFKSTLPAAPAAPSPKDQAKAELARQVAPSRSGTTTATPQGEKTYTAAEYQHWLDYRRIHDTPKERLEQMLAEMERALAEGRVKF